MNVKPKIDNGKGRLIAFDEFFNQNFFDFTLRPLRPLRLYGK